MTGKKHFGELLFLIFPLFSLRPLQQSLQSSKRRTALAHWIKNPVTFSANLLTDCFNLDHVVLSSHGVFALETKTHCKPARGSASVTFDGETLLVNGFKPERDPITQAQGNARWLSEMLRASTGKEFPIRPVVLFPSWFVEPFSKGSQTWVLNP